MPYYKFIVFMCIACLDAAILPKVRHKENKLICLINIKYLYSLHNKEHDSDWDLGYYVN